MMWLKILGVVCVGVFVGAAIVEARQLRKRGKEADEDELDNQLDNQQPEADLAHEER
jgi:uncharacterized membrane-anchored protein YhcB (DUF1043 family)